MAQEHIRQRGPVTRRYRVEFKIFTNLIAPPPPDAPLRVHREWAEALKVIYPDAEVELKSLPGLTADAVRQLKPVVKRGK